MPLISSLGVMNAINFGLASSSSSGIVSNKTLIAAHNVSPYITAYPFNMGFGSKYANPASIPTATGGQANSVTFNATGNLVAVAYSGSPHVSVYNWTAGVGFGSVFSQPATLPTGNGQGVAFNPTGTYVSVAHTTFPYVSTYAWSSGFGSKVANPATLPTATGYGVAFSPANGILSVSFDASPYIHSYPWSAGYGTVLANPGTLPTGTGNAVAYNKALTTDYPANIALANSGGGTVAVYDIYSFGWGVKYTNPSTLPATAGYSVSFNSAGNNLLVSCYAAPRIVAYPWSGSGFGTKYSDPSTAMPASFVFASGFNNAGTTVAAGSALSPFIITYSFTSGSGFGAKYADPSILPTGTVRSISFSPNS